MLGVFFCDCLRKQVVQNVFIVLLNVPIKNSNYLLFILIQLYYSKLTLLNDRKLKKYINWYIVIDFLAVHHQLRVAQTVWLLKLIHQAIYLVFCYILILD